MEDCFIFFYMNDQLFGVSGLIGLNKYYSDLGITSQNIFISSVLQGPVMAPNYVYITYAWSIRFECSRGEALYLLVIADLN